VLCDLAGREEALVEEYIEQMNLWQITDRALLLAHVKEALEANPKAAGDFLAGKKAAMKTVVGFVMKKTAGRADARLAEALALEALENQK
jgi:aspartyl-tRNA(Asn)/glutamyl-tRNA(Gln) amidotransferase subunit B